MFQGRVKRFREGIICARAYHARRLDDIMCRAQVGESLCGVLTFVVGIEIAPARLPRVAAAAVSAFSTSSVRMRSAIDQPAQSRESEVLLDGIGKPLARCTHPMSEGCYLVTLGRLRQHSLDLGRTRRLHIHTQRQLDIDVLGIGSPRTSGLATNCTICGFSPIRGAAPGAS